MASKATLIMADPIITSNTITMAVLAVAKKVKVSEEKEAKASREVTNSVTGVQVLKAHKDSEAQVHKISVAQVLKVSVAQVHKVSAGQAAKALVVQTRKSLEAKITKDSMAAHAGEPLTVK